MSALNAVTFTKYKAFDEAQTLELRPVTLVFGHNSVGKSAALRLLPILSDAASLSGENGYTSSILDYSSAALRGATFQDIVNKGTKAASLSFTMTWGSLEFSYTIKQTSFPRMEFISAFTITTADNVLSGAATDPSQDEFELSNANTKAKVNIVFEGLIPIIISDAPEDMAKTIVLLRNLLRKFSASVHWIAAVRAQPPRMFTLEPGTRIRIEHNGSGVAEALRASATLGDGVAEDVSSWLEAACRCGLNFASTDGEVFQGREWFPFDVAPHGAGGSVAVLDVGEGVAQALPVITLCHQAARGQLGSAPILALEQPELHLHPRAGALLANAIAGCVQGGSPATHLIETHSENFLLAMQIALLEGRLSKDQLVVYWVKPGPEGASLQKIVFDDQGFPSEGWPEGVFREALDQARRIGELRLL